MSLQNNKKQRIINSYKKLPLTFIPNQGLDDPQIKYSMKDKGFHCLFKTDEVLYTFFRSEKSTPPPLSIQATNSVIESEKKLRVKGINLAFRFIGSNPQPTVKGRKEEAGKVNYLRGRDPAKWVTNLSLYREIVYQELWPKIDLVFYEINNQIKYDFILQPGADIRQIQFTYVGGDQMELDEEGNLNILTSLGTLQDQKPVSYQEIDGQKIEVNSNFVLKKHASGVQVVGFNVSDDYNPQFPLVIDPGILLYSTYLGGSETDVANGIDIDTAGNAYVTGVTNSVNFPTTLGAFDTTFNGTQDAFITKLNSTGSALVYSTFLGGMGGSSAGTGIAVDFSGNAYVTGLTTSPNFPITSGAFDTTFNGTQDAFITKLNPAGSALVYSTFLGGAGGVTLGRSIAIDLSTNAYVTGSTTSPNFPFTPGAFDTTFNGIQDAFVTKLNASGNVLVYSTFLGGSDGNSSGAGITIDNTGNAYVAGTTEAGNFPATVGAFQTTISGVRDGFITKLNPAGSALIYSTLLGESASDNTNSIAVDTIGNAYVTGTTTSSDFPTTPFAFDTFEDSFNTAFVTKLNTTGSALLYSTLLEGRSESSFGSSIAVDNVGNAYVTGFTSSEEFPVTTDGFDVTFNGINDIFIAKINTNAPSPTASLVSSTYVGGRGDDRGNAIAINSVGSTAYVAGSTDSLAFPTTVGAFDRSYNNGLTDAFVLRIQF